MTQYCFNAALASKMADQQKKNIGLTLVDQHFVSVYYTLGRIYKSSKCHFVKIENNTLSAYAYHIYL